MKKLMSLCSELSATLFVVPDTYNGFDDLELITMADEKERIFTIPLRESYKKSERKRSPYTIRLVRDYLKKHTKASDVKLGDEINKAVWARGMRKPLRRIRVKAIMINDVVKAELVGFDYKEFKAAPKTEKKGAKEKLMERLGPKAMQKEKEEKAIDGTGKDESKHMEKPVKTEIQKPETA